MIDGAGRPGAEAIGNSRWIKVQELADPSTLAKISTLLDEGETEAIALALELDRVLLIDERAGRREAALHGVTMISSLTILEVAKSRGITRCSASHSRRFLILRISAQQSP